MSEMSTKNDWTSYNLQCKKMRRIRLIFVIEKWIWKSEFFNYKMTERPNKFLWPFSSSLALLINLLNSTAGRKITLGTLMYNPNSWDLTIFGLKMMVKSGLEKNSFWTFLLKKKSLVAQFWLKWLIHTFNLKRLFEKLNYLRCRSKG